MIIHYEVNSVHSGSVVPPLYVLQLLKLWIGHLYIREQTSRIKHRYIIINIIEKSHLLSLCSLSS